MVKAPDTLLFLRKQYIVYLVSTETTFTQHFVSTETTLHNTLFLPKLLYTTLCRCGMNSVLREDTKADKQTRD